MKDLEVLLKDQYPQGQKKETDTSRKKRFARLRRAIGRSPKKGKGDTK